LDQSLRISIAACDGSCITIDRSLASCGHSKTVSKTDKTDASIKLISSL